MLRDHGPIPELSILNKHPKLIDGPRFLHELVPTSSDTGAPAIDFRDNGSGRRTLTYQELHVQSDALAQRIVETLARLKNASAIVPVLLPQSPELYIALLAILKTGKAFCPIGLDTPKERLEFILRDVSAELVVTDAARGETLPRLAGLEALLVDHITPENNSASPTKTPFSKSAHLAYVLYTSGSTGVPKAVSVSHRAVTQSLLAHDRHIPRFSRFLQFAAPTFDVSIFEIFFPLHRGCTLVGCERAQMLNDLPGVITSLEVDAAELTPTVVSNLLRGRKSVPGLKLLLTIGEMLTRSVIDEFGGHGSVESILWGMYGPTEAAIHCTLQPSFSKYATVGAIGFPLDTVSAFIAEPVSESSQCSNISILPFGEIGELMIGGPQIADEYLNRPELSAASFVKHPEYGVLYRTGDKARLRQDCTLECLGRIVSGQVKLRGQRVELGEIEQLVLNVDACHSVAVMVIEDTLVAFCAVDPSRVSSAVILNTCRRWLPSYMVPSDIILLQQMPQLASGKIDKTTLKEQYQRDKYRDDSLPTRPNAENGCVITHVLQDALGRMIPADAGLDSMGLDSLRAIRIASTLRAQGYGVGPIDILSAPDIRALIAKCEKEKDNHIESGGSPNISINISDRIPELQGSHDDIEDILPCTPLQEAMLSETNTRPGAYCNWIEVEIHKPHSFLQIRGYLRELTQGNEILRSGFLNSTSASGSFVQIVWKNLAPSAIKEVNYFSRIYSLGSVDSLLRPFAVQVLVNGHKARLLFQIHHALYDGWSFDLMLRDFNHLITNKQLVARPQYREVIRYYIQLQGSDSLAKSRAYWAEVLRDYSPKGLPNFNGKVVQNNRLHSIRGECAVDSHSFLACADEHAINPQVFYQTAVAYVLSLYLGSSDVLIGSVTSGRTIPVTDVENIVGPCIASMPFRMETSGCSLIRNLLHNTQKTNREMLQHCTLPLQDIAKICGLRPGERLFEVLFVWQQSLISVDSESLQVTPVDSADDLEFKLTLEFEPHNGSVLYRITYDASILPESQIKYLVRQIDQVVNHFLANMDGELNDVSTCFSTELVSVANPTPIFDPPRYGPAHAIETRAVETPDKDALIVGGMVDGVMRAVEKVTYSSLNIRANRLSRALLEHGIGRDQLVCILMEKSADFYISVLAVLKAGCGYLPITPDTPAERTRIMLADAEVTICISNSDCSGTLQCGSFTVLALDQLDLSLYPDHDLGIPYNGSHVAYSVFTSGSTGKPKGIVVTQENLMSNLIHLSSLYPTPDGSRMLQSCSQAFDVSVFEIFFSWHVGMCLCTATMSDVFYNFEAAIDSLGITHLSLTPTVAGLVDPKIVPKVKFLVTAGEALTENVRRKWAGKGLFQGYGPSETTNICTVQPYVTAEDLINNIGKPFPNTSALVMMPGRDCILPRGAVGELCFGGAQVFRGYLKRPELNKEKIIDLPLYGRIYRSGDLGILLPNESILFAGRLDDQVKIRGQRVELGEITSLVLDHPAVECCTTLLHQHGNNSQGLITFWVPATVSVTAFGALPPAEYRSYVLDLFDTLSLQLPAYMIPTHLVPISQIPMTPQAKVDSRRLRKTFDSLPPAWLDHAAMDYDPKTEAGTFSSVEQTIADVLAQTLGMNSEEIGRTSSFFGLGLDSISAIRFSKGLRDAGLGHFTVSKILKNPTIERLSSAIAKEPQPGPKDEHLDRSLVNIFEPLQITQLLSDRGIQVQKVLPCTPLQEAMLFSDSLFGPSYHNIMVFTVNGDLDRLKRCWSLMLRRHEILRTAFVPTDHPQYAFAQVVFAPSSTQWDQLGASDDVSAYIEDVLPELIKAYQPPLRLAIQSSQSSTRLIFCCHHALYDGSAISTLLGDIQESYLGKELPPPVSYELFLKHVVTQDLHAADVFWAGCLDGFQPTFFPNLTFKPNNGEPQASSVVRPLDISLSKVLEHCQLNELSLLAVVQAAWAKLLHFCLGEEDLCFGNVVSGRTLPEEGLDRLVAPCFNTLPVRLKFSFRASNTELCKRLHLCNIESLPFQLTPLRRIQSKVLKEQGRLFDTLIILQQCSTPLNDSIWSLEDDIGEMDLPVVCEVLQHTDSDLLKVVLHYSDALLQRPDATVLAEIFNSALQSIIRFPDSPADDTVGFPTGLLGQSNMNFKSFNTPSGELLHSAFELNAFERPDGIALDFYDASGSKRTFTYGALNEMANQIAHALIEYGIGLEDLVPVHISKCPEFYASVLGVLKAGGAFAPVDPGLPEIRKRFMLSELRPKAILCLTGSLDWSADIRVLNATEVSQYSKGNPQIQSLRSTSLAYCLYTSGSTGLPKAVSMEHGAPLQTIESSRSLIPWKETSRLLQYAAITFDMCYYDCFLAWSLGFTICAAEQDTMLNDLAYTINILRVDLLDLTPSVAASLRRSEVPGVKWLYCIGEAMTFTVVEEWEGVCVNSYGPTEAAFCTTIFPACKEIKTSVIGKPFPTTCFAVFSAQCQRPVSMLGVGELHIGGSQLARGYYGKANLTEERFVQKCGQRFYKSGDMVRMLSDGNFDFLGRADDQVKVRGLRVELGEINHVIQHSDDRISDVITQILRQDAHSKGQLVCFLIHSEATDEERRAKLRFKAKQAAVDQLPAYMVPQFFLFLDRIPRSLAGKVDKKALAEIFAGSAEVNAYTNQSERDEHEYEWTANESRIREVFAKLSKTPLEVISPWTTIYQLGLDSISAAQIAATLRGQGIQVKAADVMKNMNCKDLAASVKRVSAARPAEAEFFDFRSFEQKHRRDVIRTCNIKHLNIEAVRPCTPLQNGMLSQFVAKDGDIYFNHVRLRLSSNVDLCRMRVAWEVAMRKHRMLRTGFAHIRDSKTPFAMIHYAHQSVPLPWYDAARQADSVGVWIGKSRRKAAKQLHLPPWCVRVVKEHGVTYADLGLLHAIFDALSLHLIFDDITRAYKDETVGTETPLDPLLSAIIQSIDEENTARNEFWKQMGTKAAPTRFPDLAPLRYDPAPSEVVTKPASRSLAELDVGCRKANISLQVAGMASWAALLSAYTGEPSVTFGVVLSGRNLEGSNTVAFPCITTVPFVCNSSHRKERVLREAMLTNANIQQNQSKPLNEIQRLMGYPNEPLFDSIFAYQKLSESGKKHDLWAVVEENATVEYPISIELEPQDGRLEYRLSFLPHVVPKEQASLMIDQLDHLLQLYIFEGSKRSPNATNTQSLYSVTPAKEPTLPSEARLLHEMVEQTAAKYPHRIALEFATSLHSGKCTSRKWTYTELDLEGNRVANLLLARGIRPGELVGVCFDKCPEASFAMLGILKAGCAFVALDPGAPTARKAFMIEDSGAKVVLSMKQQSVEIKDNMSTAVLNLDEVHWRAMSPKKPAIERNIIPQDRSYCLYTSGTTGIPKGCELTHENAVQALQSFQRLFAGHWDKSSRWLQFASFHFDVSVLEQYWSWCVGICVVSAPRDLIFEDLAISIRTLGITHIDLTPSLARVLHPDDVPSLCRGVFITGGESLKQEIIDVWGPKGVIYNGYGPTEATIGVTMYPRVPTNGKPSNIGPQFDNVGSYVLRPGSESPVLRGGVGELCVSGTLVGKGYLNRPDLTKERFPDLTDFNERVYRTGDLVRILHDGSFDFLGRADDQVKLRGQRLEIGEINSTIRQSANAVVDVATLVLKHPKQQKEQLISFVVTGSRARGEAKIVLEKSHELAQARQACQENLPPYMVPTHFVAVTKLPLSTNNKADARRLKDMYEGLTVNDLQLLSSIFQSKDEKWSNQEEKIRNVLKEVLGISEDFGKDTSFFELGMDSISVLGVLRALKQAGFSQAMASMIMTNATLRRLNKAFSTSTSASSDRGSILGAQQSITAIQHRHRRSVAETLFTDARNVEALAPCTPLQQGMIARSLEIENGLYFNVFRFQLTKTYEPQKLEDAWQDVVNSTQILRTAFVNTEDGFVQAALRRTPLRFEHIILSGGTATEGFLSQRKKDWVRRNQSVIKTPFELVLLSTPDHDLLVVHIFHALYDGNSIGLLFKSVWKAYNGCTIPPGLPFQSALPYGPLRSIHGAKEFWERHLTEKALRPFPTLIDQASGEHTAVSRMVNNLEGFEAARRGLNVTAQAIAQACWVSVLHRFVKGTVTVGMVVSGRSIDFERANELIGPLFNTIPYQYRPHQRETWASIIKRAHDFNTAAHPYQHTPLRQIMRWCKRGPSQPLFDTLFVYQVVDGDEEWAKNHVWELVNGGADPDYPLAIEVEQWGSEALRLNLVAQGHVLNEKIAGEFLDHLEAALRGALQDSDTVIETLSDEGEEVVNGTIRDGGRPMPISFDRKGDFEWTNIANMLREELANLTGTAPGDIDEATSILELGLDSIDAIKLSSRLKKRGINLPVSGIMRSLTIANMLQHVSRDKKKWNQRPSDMIYQSHKRRLESYLQNRGETKGVEQILPLTPLQEAMVAEMIASQYKRYYNHDVLKLEPGTDIERLQRAWTEVVKMSPMLRTSFIQVEDPSIDFSFAQVIRQEPHAFWYLKEVDGELDFPAIFESIRREAAKGFDSDPLFHVRLIQSPEHTYLVLSIAHALYDGWSLGLLHADVQQASNGELKPRPSYESALHEILTSSGSDAVAFWRDYLSGAKFFPFDRRQLSDKHDSWTLHRKEQASRISLAEMTSFVKKTNITLQTLGQTVYGMTLASYTRSLDVTFGSVLSGRDDEDRAKLLFPTMNTVAIRTILHGARVEMLQYVQDNFSNIKQWQHFPLRKALNLAGVQGSLFESLFIYQKSMDDGKAKTKKLYESIEGYSDVEYPVCVEMEVVGEELVWRCAVKEEVFDELGAQELLDRLDEVLKSIIEQPDASTIDFTTDGTSICGLSTFEDKHSRYAEAENDEGGSQMHERANSTTARAIREALAFVSKTPERDITEGMTIFHIGLDSISAIKVSSLLRKRNIILSVGEMLRAATVEKMAQIVDKRALLSEEKDYDASAVLEAALTGLNRAEVLRRAGIEETEVEQMLPATAGQVCMLSIWIKSQGSAFYPEFTYEVQGSIEFEALTKAWQDLVGTNSILRTRLLATENKHMPYVQVVFRESEANVLDITGWAEDRISRVNMERTSAQPYAYISALRSTKGWTLRLKVHHALYDGVSLPLLMQQLQNLCVGAEPPVSSSAASRFIASTSFTSARDNRKAYWTNYLKDITQHVVPQPISAPTSKVEIFKPGLIPSIEEVEALARNNGITTQALLLAAYAKLYAALTSTPGNQDVVIAIYLANRSLPIHDIAQAAIPTVNLVPLRVSAPLETDMLDAAAQIQLDIQEISSATNASASLWEINDWTGVKIDTFVNFLKLPDVEGELDSQVGGVKIVPVGQWSEAVSRVTKLRTVGFEVPDGLKNERVNSAYLHAIDVEATIRNGALDVGVFAPEEVLNLWDGEKLVDDIRLGLEGLVNDVM
ncbi:nonribosomal peptide synthetase 2 [Lentithecium fluviatile CBS 122367]|uniref:Nonribosomal peptide synthetase 2 n=1 Tax=Lentithecium fluviatile CBS 122367 TaxID=1168545 RepID=A0A6G1JAA1_9PLEO|nr:nonribosomal peptide synthetase 2 [Lentithecium fluviatile CBS 122367]